MERSPIFIRINLEKSCSVVLFFVHLYEIMVCHIGATPNLGERKQQTNNIKLQTSLQWTM